MIESVLEEEVERKKVDWETETEKEVRKEKRRVLGGLKKSLKLVRENFIPRYLKYQHQKELLGDRNSYSKTNPDATFMRMKDDHMKNGQLKPGYNVQMATENQFILFYSVHQRPTDTRSLIPHLEAYRQTNLPMPKRVVADAGYGSEENYRYLIGDSETEPIAEFLIPYNTYLKEKTKGYRNNPYNAKNWDYVEEDDLFICPNGRRVPFKKYMKKKNASGFVQDFKIYECEDCSDCPLKALCTKAKGNRQVHWNPVYEELKETAKKALEDETFKHVYSRRKIEVETVFGNLKSNLAFRQFLLRGLEKVQTEFAILAMAHNLLKVVGLLCRNHLIKRKIKKEGGEKRFIFLHLLHFRDFLDSPFIIYEFTIELASSSITFAVFTTSSATNKCVQFSNGITSEFGICSFM